METKAVITTKKEQQSINHRRVLVLRDGVRPETLVNEALQAIEGKEYYDKVVIGLDPGEVLGLAVLVDGKVIETENCFSVEDAANRIGKMLKNLESTPVTSVSVKVGNGVPAYKEKLLQVLDKALPSHIMLGGASEAGTSRRLNEATHRRGIRDIVSAVRIAGKSGQRFPRRKTNESNS